MDIKARHHGETKNTAFLFLRDSWNVTGKPITDQALTRITGMEKDELHRDRDLYLQLIGDNLEETLRIARILAQENIDRSKELMNPLGLMESGLYFDGGDTIPLEFRDDVNDYRLFVQQRFMEWYHRGIVYMKTDGAKPSFFMDIERLYAEKPLEKLLEGLKADRQVIAEFGNNYKIYRADLPVSTCGGYGTPVPLYVDNYGNIQIPQLGSEPMDPRLDSENKNHLLIIKPLVNCYLFAEYLGRRFGGFDSLNMANDYHMVTRINFVSNLLSERNYRVMNLHIFNLLKTIEGDVLSYKAGVLQSIENLESKARGLARFTIIKNTRLGYGYSRLTVDSQTFERIRKILEEEKEWTKSDKVFSRMFKKEVSVSEFVSRELEKGNVSLALNFLIDALFQNPSNSTVRYYLLLLL